MSSALRYTGPMLNKSGATSVVQRFMNLIRALNDGAACPALDAAEEQLLNQLANAWNSNQRVLAPEPTVLPRSSSTYSIENRLESLARRGVIRFLPDEGDDRTRYVVATALTSDYRIRLKSRLVPSPRSSY